MTARPVRLDAARETGARTTTNEVPPSLRGPAGDTGCTSPAGERPPTERAIWALLSHQPRWIGVAAIVVTLGGAYALTVVSWPAEVMSPRLVLHAGGPGGRPLRWTRDVWHRLRCHAARGAVRPGGPAAGVWLTRSVFHIAIGLLMGVASSAARTVARRERELAEREARLLRQRTAPIQSVSHAFRTPLTVIHGVAVTLGRRDDAVQPAFRPLVGALGRATTRLRQLVSVVLAAGVATDGGEREERAVLVGQLIEGR